MATRPDREATRALQRDLAVIDLDGPPLARWLSDRLLGPLRTEHAMVYTPAWDSGVFRMGQFAIAGPGAQREAPVRELFDEHIQRSTGVWSFYDPIRVEPAQQNRAIAVGSHRSLTAGGLSGPMARVVPLAEQDKRAAFIALARPGFELWGTYSAQTLRVLICDGPRMLGWVGVLQDERFEPVAKRAFQTLVPAIQRRFLLEHRLGMPAHAGLTMALLEEIAGAVYLLNGKDVVACNTRGRAAIDREPRRALKLVEIAKRGGDPETTVVDLTSRGVPKHSLLIVRSAPEPLPESLAVIARRHRLTPREAAVLLELGKGRTNRTISVALSCAERTVETHVSRILHKTDCASRAELVALAWSVRAG